MLIPRIDDPTSFVNVDVAEAKAAVAQNPTASKYYLTDHVASTASNTVRPAFDGNTVRALAAKSSSFPWVPVVGGVAAIGLLLWWIRR